MDKLALAVGNILLGNQLSSAGIEITICPFRVRFHQDTSIALTGADCLATLDDVPVLPWWTRSVRAGQVLTLHTPVHGARAYLTVGGGIDVPVVMGSRSTDLKANFGGYRGRALKKGDILNIGASLRPAASASAGTDDFGVEPPASALPSNGLPQNLPGVISVRVLPGAEYERFPESALELFWRTDWVITPNSNRVGYKFIGPPILPSTDLEVFSHGLVPGVIQIPPSGQPMIQMVDCNSSGGYPNLGTVIEADYWRLAQARLSGAIRFVKTTHPEAVSALAAERDYLNTVTRMANVFRAGKPGAVNSVRASVRRRAGA
jgi:biotin-dependent carboxylase-like uncharacterized protein